MCSLRCYKDIFKIQIYKHINLGLSANVVFQIAEILCNIGVKLSDEEFEHVWNLASKKHHRGEVCVENIRNVLDELQHADRIKCKTTM